MRKLLAGLAAVAISTAAFTATFALSGGFASHTVATVDPTVSQPVTLTAADAAADGWTADCAHWGQVYGQITIRGTRTFTARGCVNPSGLGKGDSFANGTLGRLLASASR